MSRGVYRKMPNKCQGLEELYAKKISACKRLRGTIRLVAEVGAERAQVNVIKNIKEITDVPQA